MKKLSPSSSSSSSSTASSSSPIDQISKPVSSVSASPSIIKPVKPKTKRTRRNPNPEKKTQFANSPGRRSSIYRGVTRHRWTGRYEAHLWDKNSWNPIQNKKGRQVYLGAYDDEEAAAHTYDLAALKYWGPDTILNFPLNTYTKEYEEMQNVSKEEYLASLRRRSSGFSRGVSKYRGVARHHHNGRWEARIGRVFGNKYLYLGTYSTQEEAAAAYDMAAIEYRGLNAVTNFDISHYVKCPPQPAQSQAPAAEPAPAASFQQSFAEFNGSSAQELMTPSQVPISPELSVDQSTVIDPMCDHPWSFSLDSGFNPLPVPDSGLEKSSEISDLFNVDMGFEDNIEFLFEGICSGNKGNEEDNGINLDGIFDNSNEFDGGNLLMEDEAKCGLIGEMENLNNGSTMASTSVTYPFPIRICS